MNFKTFGRVNAIIAAIFASIIGVSVVTDNLILAVVSAVVMIVIVLVLKKRVRGVTSDERDLANAGKAARMAVSVFSVVGAVLGIALLFMHYGAIGSIISDCVCALLLIQSAFYFYYAKQN